jgi:hypothetical protein
MPLCYDVMLQENLGPESIRRRIDSKLFKTIFSFFIGICLMLCKAAPSHLVQLDTEAG